MSRKIAVLGTGANGSCAAADLTRAGRDVVLIDQWPAHVEAMRAEGLCVTMPDEERHVRVRAHHLCEVCTFQEKFDVVLLFVKAYDTRWACELIKPYLKDDGLLVGVQNAMTAGDIAAVVGPGRTLGCVVELSSEIFTPGLVQRNTPPERTWFGVGSLGPEAEGREGEIAEILGDVGRTSISSNILSAKWMKLIVNAMTMGPRAMLGLKAMEAMELPGMREIALRAGEEALAAGQRLGYRIEPIFGLTREDVDGSNRLLELLLDRIIADVGPHARDAVLHDHLKGRYSEVDQINGLVVDEARRAGASAPVNQMVVEITRRIHAGELRPEPSNLDLAQRMLAN